VCIFFVSFFRSSDTIIDNELCQFLNNSICSRDDLSEYPFQVTFRDHRHIILNHIRKPFRLPVSILERITLNILIKSKFRLKKKYIVNWFIITHSVAYSVFKKISLIEKRKKFRMLKYITNKKIYTFPPTLTLTACRRGLILVYSNLHFAFFPRRSMSLCLF